MKKLLVTPILVTVMILLPATFAQAAFKEPASFLNPKQVMEIGPKSGSKDDSDSFQKAIDKVHSKGGGHLIVLSGDYFLMDVQLKSDVHVIFRSGAIVFPVDGKEGNIFNLGMKEKAENVSLIGSAGWTYFDFTKAKGRLRAFIVNDCSNFQIKNFVIDDSFTTFSSLTLGWGGVEKGKALIARDVLIENLTALNAHYGYGAIQAHSGESIVFRNIKAKGGVAVRLETGLGNMNKSGVGGLFDITVEDVISINGHGALMFQPHTMNHGHVRARNVRSDGSEFALLIAQSFVSAKKFGEGSKKKPGGYASITVDGVKAVYRDGPIVTRYPHLKYYPEELHGMIKRVDNGDQPGYIGPSIAAVVNMQPELDSIKITNVEAIGFKYHPDIIGPDDLFKGSVKHLTQPAP